MLLQDDFGKETPVIIFVYQKYFEGTPEEVFNISSAKKKWLQRQALGAFIESIVGHVYVFDVGVGACEIGYSVVCHDRKSAAKFLKVFRAMRQKSGKFSKTTGKRYWKDEWLHASWLRCVTCLCSDLSVTVKSCRGTRMYHVKYL